MGTEKIPQEKKNRFRAAVFSLAGAVSIAALTGTAQADASTTNISTTDASQAGAFQAGASQAGASPETSLDASQIGQPPRTTYEIFTGSFADSNGDGTGDLNGIRDHLDYINDGDPQTDDDLGCDGIWLTPIFPSPTYHKYDARDYMNIDPDFGTMEDFDKLLEACHKRGIRLYLDLAVNHTSVEHPWFQQAADYIRKNSGELSAQAEEDKSEDTAGITFSQEALKDCPTLDYYNFIREPREGYTQLGDSGFYYESRFWEGMPDLNLDSDAVRSEIAGITKFWLDRGVDGFRLDAVTSYYTDDKNKSIAFLTWLTDTVKSQKTDAYLVGECWADQATIADYAKSGIDSLFDFPFADQDGVIADAVRSENGALKWGKAMEKATQLYAEVNPDFIDAPFYTNHDMARSAGYYPYDDGTKAKLSGGMNLMMKGNAFVYYGEEVGLKGSGKDENKRAPMPWADADSPAGGESMLTEDSVTAGPEGIMFTEASVTGGQESMFTEASVTADPGGMDKTDLRYGSAEDQISDPDSILFYFRKAIRLRSEYPALSEGETKVIDSLSSDQVCVFTRSAARSASVLVAVNVSGQKAEIDLAADPLAEGYRTLAESLNAQSEESAKAAREGGEKQGRRRRRGSSGGRGRKESQETSQNTEAQNSISEDVSGQELTLTSSLEGSRLTIPPYGIAVLTS